MIEDDLNRLIELNEKIVNQNDEIIHLLLKLNGIENETQKTSAKDVKIKKSVENTETLTDAEEIDKTSDDMENKEILFDGELDSGEVFFVANAQDNNVDVFKISVKDSGELKVSPPEIKDKIRENFGDSNFEITLDNLTGDDITYQFIVPLSVAFESFKKNIQISSSIAILDDEQFINLPDILRVAIERGAKTVYSSMKNGMAVLQAPPMIMDYLTFYKNNEQLFEKLFDE